ncbi:MAG: lipopolysaccharide biosynthesis protein [Christensenellales bacterium]
MARKERTIKNSITAVVKYVIKLILQFVLRTVIIYKLGVEYVGLDSLYANIISMLSLAELGIGTAIVFSMYKPASENDIEKLKSLNNFYKKIYMIIAVVVLVLGLAIMPFIKNFISEEPNVNVNLYVVYAIFLANTVISYFGAHKRSLLFAFQRNDIENNILTIATILMSIFQIVMLLLFKNYYLYVILIPLFTLFDVILYVCVAKKLYPDITGKSEPLDKETKKEITKNIIATSCHQIGAVIVLSTDNLLISKFFGLTALGTISNYILVYSAIDSLINIFINALQASVGNLITTTNKEYVYKIYKMFNWIFACIVGFCSIALMCLYKPFINIWVGDTEYKVTFGLIFALVGKFYFMKMRSLTNMFKNCAGLMWNDRWKPICESILNIVASLVFIKLIGVEGIFVGTIVSTICVPLWVEPYVLYKNYFKMSVKDYFGKFALYTLITLIAGGVTYGLCAILPEVGLWWFVLKVGICAIVPNVIYLLVYLKTDNFKMAWNFAKSFIKKKKSIANEINSDEKSD